MTANLRDAEFIERRTTTVVLADGTMLVIRPVVPKDKQRFLDGFARLSAESRYRRFMAPIDELTPDMLRQFTEVDYVDHFAYVALLADEPGLPGVGVARYVRLEDDPEVAEAAITVIDDYQGRGVGTLLLEALGAVALENGIRRFRGYVLEQNRPMIELLGDGGVGMEHDGPGLVRVEVDLPGRAEALRGTPMYRVFRALARGERPVTVRLREYWSKLLGPSRPTG
jgi:GNAT superfamily N-acetyltransferase